MSRVRTILVEKQDYAPAATVPHVKPGLKMTRVRGNYLRVDELNWTDSLWEKAIVCQPNDMKISQKDDAVTLRGNHNYAAIAEGYIYVPEDGVYYLSSRLDQLWIDNKLVISNEGEVKATSSHDTSLALAKGLHPVKMVFLANIIGGWPGWWSDLSLEMRKDTERQFTKVSNEQYYY